ncbi:hypothetical protein WR25_08400 [Diploscapter pachys]|uniref:Uncharacterized protein n=1 Tax=Diploscapter pachys TaxID=2018661 RepID=A0A2A2M562_9BILA|nr:hypothetical protein WR25_08400 [Diploscapter pachys]
MLTVEHLQRHLQQPVGRARYTLLAAQAQAALVAFELPDARPGAAFQAQFGQASLGGEQGQRLVAQQPVPLGHQAAGAHGGGHGHRHDGQRHQHFDQGETILGGTHRAPFAQGKAAL